MKSNRTTKKLLLLLTILTILFSFCLNSHHKKTIKKSKEEKTKTKDYGSGDMTTGFICPFIEIYDAQENTKLSTTGKYFFKPKDFSERLGFIIKFEETDRRLNNYLKVHKGKVVYIPWRYFDSITYYKKTFSYKVIEAVLRNDQSEKLRIKFNLPWTYYSEIITENDVNEIISDMEKYRDIQRRKLTQRKNTVSALVSSLFKSKAALVSQKVNAIIFKENTKRSLVIAQANLLMKKKQLEEIDRKIKINKGHMLLIESNYNDIRNSLSLLQRTNENNMRLMDDSLRKGMFQDNHKKIVDSRSLIKTDVRIIANACKNLNTEKLQNAALNGDSDLTNNLMLAIKPTNN